VTRGATVPDLRLRTVAAASVTVAVVACQGEAAHIVRAYRSVAFEGFEYVRFWERFFVDPPNPSSPLVSLAAVTLLLLLPAAPRFDRWRLATGLLVGLASVTVIVHAVAHLWLAGWGLPRLGLGPFPRNLLRDLPAVAVSAVVLFLTVDIWRWGERTPPVAESPLRIVEDLDGYLDLA